MTYLNKKCINQIPPTLRVELKRSSENGIAPPPPLPPTASNVQFMQILNQHTLEENMSFANNLYNF
jgi:hypothetical protein